MYYDVTKVAALDGYRLSLSFEDGRSGVFHMAGYLELPVFAPLRLPALFARAFVDEGSRGLRRRPRAERTARMRGASRYNAERASAARRSFAPMGSTGYLPKA